MASSNRKFLSTENERYLNQFGVTFGESAFDSNINDITSTHSETSGSESTQRKYYGISAPFYLRSWDNNSMFFFAIYGLLLKNTYDEKCKRLNIHFFEHDIHLSEYVNV